MFNVDEIAGYLTECFGYVLLNIYVIHALSSCVYFIASIFLNEEEF